MRSYPTLSLVSLLIIFILVPTPAQALCVGPEACGILASAFLSMVTVPLCIITFVILLIPKKHRWLLRVFAILPAIMTLLTGYLVLIQGQRLDLYFIPLIHFVLMGLMILISDPSRYMKRRNIDNIGQ